MRVLVVTPYFHPHIGGSERYVEELYRTVRRINPKIEVDILTYNTNKKEKVKKFQGMTVYRIGCWEVLKDQFSIPNYFELVKLLGKLRRNNYRVVNAHTRFFDTAWWGWLAAKYLGAKSILTDHCADHPKHENKIIQLLVRWLDILIIPILGRVYDQVTVVSKATGDFLVNLGLGKQPKVIYGGVDSAVYSKRRSHGGINVAFIGRMIPSKGPQLMVETAKKLIKKYPQVIFMMAGEGELLKDLKQKETNRLQFLGNISREGVVQLLVKTDIVVAPSTHHEGLPSVILEAGAAGCAVVTTNRGGVGEIVENGKTGLLIGANVEEIMNALELLINDEALRISIRRNLQKAVREKFEWGNIAKKFLRLLN